MTSVYVRNVVKRVTVAPGYSGGAGGTGTSTNVLTSNNAWSGTNAFNNAATHSPNTASVVPLTVSGISGQSVGLTQWKDFQSNILAEVDQLGQISTATNMYVGRGVSAGGGNKVLVLANASIPNSNPVGGGILYSDSGALRFRDPSGTISGLAPLPSTKGNVLVSNGTSWIRLAVGANGTFLTADSVEATGVKWATVSGSGHTIQNSTGTPLTQRTNLQFTGAGVASVADDSGNNRTVVTISGGGGGGFYQTVKENGTARTARAALNFGSMFTVTDDSVNNESDVVVKSDLAAGTASLRTLGTSATQAAAGDHSHSVFTSTSDASTPLSVREFSNNMTVPIFQVTDSLGTTYYARVSSSGDFYVGNAGMGSMNAKLRVKTDNAAARAVNIMAAPSQSANVFEIQDSGGVGKVWVDSTFKINASNIGAKVVVLDSAAAVPSDTPSGSVILRRPA